MPYTVISKPALGDATKKSLADAIIDNLDYLKTIADSIGGLDGTTIPNGSFENDSDADGTPDGWAKTTWSGGTLTIADQNAAAGNSYHGRYAAKLASTGSGGGTLTSADYFPVTPGNPVFLTWAMKGTADVRNIVQLFWYQGDSGKSASVTASTTVYDEATGNPTDWQVLVAAAYPPSDARWAKIKLTGCDSSDATVGNVTFDALFMVEPQFLRSNSYATAGTFKWLAPVTGIARVRLIGGGAGGGTGGGGQGGGGGGAGEYVEALVAVTSGTAYTLVVGAAGGVGANGSNSTFNTTSAIAAGGTAGVGGGGGGAGGAGGTGGTGYLKIAGVAGQNQAAGTGGVGGGAVTGGGGGANNGGAGQSPGGGGGGGDNGGAAGAAGAAGKVVVEW